MVFKVEKGIPVPSRGPAPSGQSRYPFAEMEVGDSFIGTAAAASAASLWAKSHPPQKFTSRKLGKGSTPYEKDCPRRIWRVA